MAGDHLWKCHLPVTTYQALIEPDVIKQRVMSLIYQAGTRNPYELKPSNVNFADKAVSVMTPKGFCFVLLSSE